ncbi:nitrate reductase molybdenum cofactor assembly chaperone [Phaeacidiphilus oryzae]|uniref:nitrate reductase molybdenum cofactor assembly chaperone n=1 Tax=Phaeacidiphilus oryzae TaxID=348818 RepID=UPI000691CCF1|nr:nitrate reductase molybdenum cofactor assembly chaperone [Phaeacidiphilus oryzae]
MTDRQRGGGDWGTALSGYGALGGDGEPEAMERAAAGPLAGEPEAGVPVAGDPSGGPPTGARGARLVAPARGLRRLLLRARGEAPPSEATRLAWCVIGWALRYPDESLRERIPAARALVDGLAAGPPGVAVALAEFLDHLAGEDDYALAEHYVAVFDRRNRHSLHLSWWTDGDTRRRGAGLVRFRQLYRAYGLVQREDGELPDFLPVVLEFAAAHPEAGVRLLAEHHRALRELTAALHRARTPYARLLDALLATVPAEARQTPVTAAPLGGPRP